jgi:Ca2+/Na+ antiporter
MAEIKKDAPKEAPKKEGSKDEKSWFITFFPLVFIAFLLIVGSRMNGEDPFGRKIENPEKDFIAGKKDFLNIYEWIGTGQLEQDTQIINSAEVTVRNAPAGSIIGTQKKLATGILKTGPITAFNTLWWRVDYPDAPDGWVDTYQISSKIGVIRLINIVPLVYGFYKPIGYTLLILLLILVIYFKFLLKKEETIAEKKKQLKDELYQEKPIPLAVRIEQKPDVEEIAGFRTEEIVPIQVLEQQNRWVNIQELIKSYNANDWRQAIIEADIILEEMLDKMQYEGLTIGDKLKKVEKSDFVTLDRAWSAHKVRNQIAHDGSNFKLSREVAEKTIKDYEEVFREFYYI